MNCRHCKNELANVFADLGFAPPSNAYPTAQDLLKPELTYPLKVMVCDRCWLVQTQDYTQAEELFSSSYAYFSSTSSTWLEHARIYTDQIIKRLSLDKDSFVVELASNDGYLLKNFLAAGIPCLGIEPTSDTADAAEALGIPVRREFFGEILAKNLVKESGKANLVIGNNVYAHVPDINDFTAGMKFLLNTGGTITLEFPHLLNLIQQKQFDTIYHEHFSYLSLYTVSKIFQAHGLKVINIESLTTHGGSLRVYGAHEEDVRIPDSQVMDTMKREELAGMQSLEIYSEFQTSINTIKDNFLAYLLAQKKAGRKVVAYGAAAKGNTILNYAGIKPDLIAAVFDAAPSKQNKFLPGSHIPVFSPEKIEEIAADIILILPWNLADEIYNYLQDKVPASTTFVVAVPKIREL